MLIALCDCGDLYNSLFPNLKAIDPTSSERRRMTYKKIKLYCETHGISIRRFEIMCGLGNGVVDDWKEESEPALKSLKKIATATGIPIAEWL